MTADALAEGSGVVAAPEPSAPGTAPLRRSLVLAVGVGVAVALCVVAIAYAILAIPFYALAQVEPQQGLDRPFIRDGITRIALPAGLAVGVVTGAVVARWYARGGRLPTE